MQRAHALHADRLLRGGALLVLGASAYSVGLRCVADYLSRGATLTGREYAVHLLPASGVLHQRLAELQDDPTREWQRATALEPANASYWEQLGSQAELAGDVPLAKQALLEAAARSRLYQPRYLLAQYYFRRGDTAECERWSRAALAVAPGDVTPLLDLLWRIDPPLADARAVPERPLIARQVVTFLVNHGNAGEARHLAEHLAETGGADDLGSLLGYTNQMLADAQIEAALTLWNTLCRRRIVPYAANETVTNADFAHPPIGGGLDWHFEPPQGVALSRGHGELHATFDGNQPEASVLIWQYVRLRTGAAVGLRNPGLPNGLTWTFFVPGERGWRPWSGLGPAPADLARLALMYRRPVGAPRLRGTVTVSSVRLDLAP